MSQVQRRRLRQARIETDPKLKKFEELIKKAESISFFPPIEISAYTEYLPIVLKNGQYVWPSLDDFVVYMRTFLRTATIEHLSRENIAYRIQQQNILQKIVDFTEIELNKANKKRAGLSLYTPVVRRELTLRARALQHDIQYSRRVYESPILKPMPENIITFLNNQLRRLDSWTPPGSPFVMERRCALEMLQEQIHLEFDEEHFQ